MKNSLKTLTRATALLAATLAARGNVTIAQFTGTGQFSYAVDYMTDLDQRREGLPGNGKAYCVPTSAMNLLSYAANFGFPQLLPGPGVWEGTEHYEEMTGYLETLGLLMDTDPDTGSGLSGQNDGFAAWLESSQLGAMSVVSFARVDDYWPTIDVGAFMATAGAVVNFAYGRYDFVPGFQGVPWMTERHVGHSVTLQRTVAFNGSLQGPRALRMHNPSTPSDDSLTSNTDYSSQDLPTTTNMDVGLDVDGDGDYEIFNATSLLNPPPEDNRYRLIDSITGLYPPGGLSYSGVEVNAQFVGGGLGFVANRPPTKYGAGADAAFISEIPHPELHSGLAILRRASGDALYQLPNGGKQGQALMALPTGSKFLVLGYGHTVYGISPTQILGLEVRGQEAKRLGAIALPTVVRNVPIEAATYNEATDELLLVSGSRSRLFVFDAASLKLTASYALSTPFPAAAARSLAVVPIPPKSSASMPSVDPRRVLIAFANGRLAEIAYQGSAPGLSTLVAKAVDLPGVLEPLSVGFDGGRRLYVADRRAGLLEFDSLNGRGWTQAVRPFYRASQFVGRSFAPFRSRSNLRPEIHDRPEWRNVIDEWK